jgi:hypothetical protein
VVLSACTTCVCQADGTVGLCTGACPPDAAIVSDAVVTCTQNGQTYQAGEVIRISACASCVCQQDGTIGMCTGDCPPDGAIAVDGPVTCTLDGRTYEVGERYNPGSCMSCACMPDGTWGMCTGACPPPTDAAPDVTSGPAALCVNTGGQVKTSLCCLSTSDFPSECAPGPCGCAPDDSHTINICSCPAGTCFESDRGCVGIPGVCTPGADQTCNDNPAFSSIHGTCQSDGSCVCSPGFSLLTSGKCS